MSDPGVTEYATDVVNTPVSIAYLPGSPQRAYADEALLAQLGWQRDPVTHRWRRVAKQHSGVWLGFVLDRAVAEDLVQQLSLPPEVGLEDVLHVTVAYLPGSIDNVSLQSLLGALTALTLETPPLGATLGGVAQFAASQTSDNLDVFVALVDSAALEQLRARVCTLYTALGMPLPETHGYTPHITLQYVASGTPASFPPLAAVPMTLGTLTVKQGDTVLATLPLQGRQEVQMGKVTYTLEVPITKLDLVQQRVWGWASVAVRKDGQPIVDTQGDVIAIEDLEEAFYVYFKESGRLNFMHDGPTRGHLIEMMVFTPEKVAKLGIPVGLVPSGAWVGYEIPDPEDFAKAAVDGLVMFSIEGMAEKEEMLA